MDLVDQDATQQAELIAGRAVSARELLDAHIERIHQVNPVLNAIVSLDIEGARRQADAADTLIASGVDVGPLHGLPIAFKDTHHTAGMRTTYGSMRNADHVPDVDDLHVRRITTAGAIRLGKTNVPEYAAGSHTVNRVFGATRNPYDPRLSAGGSSGGAAAALAAGMQPIADGSDMGGSLRNPAAFCNVVGLRPTPGLVPNADGSNVFTPLSVVGPMARSVADVALVLSVMAGPSARDPYSSAMSSSTAVSRSDFSGLRVAWTPDLGGRIPVERDVLDVLEPQVALFTELGALVEQDCPDLDGAEECFRVLRAAEFAAEWGELLREDPDEFGAFLAGNIEQGLSLTAVDVVRAEQEMTRLVRAGADFFARYDLLLAPVTQVAPFDVSLRYPATVAGLAQPDYLGWMRSAFLLTPLGVPALSVPAGFTPAGAPIGLQLLSGRSTDFQLLEIAKVYEAATRFGRTRPTLTASLGASDTRDGGAV